MNKKTIKFWENAKTLNSTILSFDGLNAYNKIYKVTLIIALISGIALILYPKTYPLIVTEITLVVFFIACCIINITEFFEDSGKMFSSKLFPYLFAGLTFIMLVIAEIQINIFMNSFTGLDPSYFSHGNFSLKVIFITVNWLIITSSFFMFRILIRIIFFREFNLTYDTKIKVFDNLRKLIKQYKKAFSILSFLGFFTMIILLSNNINKENGILNTYAKRLLILSEYFQYSNCDFDNDTELVAQIDSARISVYNKTTKEKPITRKCYLIR